MIIERSVEEEVRALTLWVGREGDGGAEREHLSVLMHIGGKEFQRFVSPGTIHEIAASATKLLDRVVTLLTKWSLEGETRRLEDLVDTLRFRGAAFGKLMFPKDAQNAIAAYTRDFGVICILSEEVGEVSRWPWEAALICCGAEDIVGVNVAGDGKGIAAGNEDEGKAKELSVEESGEFVLGQTFVVCVPAIDRVRPSLDGTRLDGRRVVVLTHEKAIEAARALGAEEEVSGMVQLERVAEMRAAVKGMHCVAIVCHSTLSVAPDAKVKATREAGAADGFGLWLTADGQKATASEFAGVEFAPHSVVMLCACKAGTSGLPEVVTAGSGCTVLTPYAVIPADVGIMLTQALLGRLGEDGVAKSWIELLREWRREYFPYGLLFGSYGPWDTVFENTE